MLLWKNGSCHGIRRSKGIVLSSGLWPVASASTVATEETLLSIQLTFSMLLEYIGGSGEGPGQCKQDGFVDKLQDFLDESRWVCMDALLALCLPWLFAVSFLVYRDVVKGVTSGALLGGGSRQSG
jgi:hypothetical protein